MEDKKIYNTKTYYIPQEVHDIAVKSAKKKLRSVSNYIVYLIKKDAGK